MKPIYRFALLGTLSLALGACELMPTREAGSVVKAPPVLPFEEPVVEAAELDADLLYSYLVSDIAAQRGELPLAYSHSLHAAKIAQDPAAAERATRIAVYLQDMDGALAAARRWAKLAPNNPDARMSLALLLDRAGDRPAALQELNALLQIADALEHDGFVQIGQVLGKERGGDPLGLMQAVVEMHPEDARAHYGLAMVALVQQNFALAEGSLRQALQLRPKWPEAEVLLARARVGLGDKAGALAGLSAALNNQSDSQLLRSARARLRVDQEDHAGALADFRRLHRSEPENTEYTYALGMLAMQVEKWDEARRAWQRLRSQGGDRFAEATYFLGQVEEKTGHPARAAGLYAGVDRGPLQVDAGLKLADLEAVEGKLDAARERLQRLRQQQPDRAVDTYLAEARLLREAGQAAQAIQVLDKAVEETPDNLSLRYGRAMEAARADNLALLEQDLKYILALEPDHVDALNALGYTLVDRTDRLTEAEGYIQRAFVLRPDSAAILDSMGWLYYRQGRHEQALDYLRRAFDKLVDHEIAAHLGEVLWVTGDRAAARSVWRKGLKQDPDSKVLHEVMQRLQ